ncbi:hypothetical protein [Providencia manganoxydans]|uniref:hypothetical protein n=1 Tax=Providencia manganoxydans TaxID=2923283 RepID=UPI0032DB6704
MEYKNNADLLPRLESMEVALAYTLTAISEINPHMKDNVVKALRDDANLNTTENEKALSNLASLIESFKLND